VSDDGIGENEPGDQEDNEQEGQVENTGAEHPSVDNAHDEYMTGPFTSFSFEEQRPGEMPPRDELEAEQFQPEEHADSSETQDPPDEPPEPGQHLVVEPPWL
jgi:hypothetical protein